MPLETDICTTLGRTFMEATKYLDDELTGQDCYEVFTTVLAPPITLDRLRSLQDRDFVLLQEALAKYLELDSTPNVDFRSIVAITLDHWEQSE